MSHSRCGCDLQHPGESLNMGHGPEPSPRGRLHGLQICKSNRMSTLRMNGNSVSLKTTTALTGEIKISESTGTSPFRGLTLRFFRDPPQAAFTEIDCDSRFSEPAEDHRGGEAVSATTGTHLPRGLRPPVSIPSQHTRDLHPPALCASGCVLPISPSRFPYRC